MTGSLSVHVHTMKIQLLHTCACDQLTLLWDFQSRAFALNTHHQASSLSAKLEMRHYNTVSVYTLLTSLYMNDSSWCVTQTAAFSSLSDTITHNHTHNALSGSLLINNHNCMCSPSLNLILTSALKPSLNSQTVL